VNVGLFEELTSHRFAGAAFEEDVVGDNDRDAAVLLQDGEDVLEKVELLIARASQRESFVSRFEKLVSVSEEGQLAMRELIKAHLRQIEHDAAGFAVRLFPFTRKHDLDQPKIVVIDPFISFGRPTITGTGITTSILAERYKAGDSMDALAEDYGCERAQVEEAVRCELALAA
jgi:uncharacterized protein (DUF433 family)